MAKALRSAGVVGSRGRRLLPLAAAVAAVGFAGTAYGQSWVGATGGEWNDAANWTPNTVPNAADAAVSINVAHTVNLAGGPFAFGSISTSLASGSVILGNNGTTTDQLLAQTTIGSPTFTITNGAASIFFYANLLGTQGFTKAGAGKMTFRFNGADQTYAGLINISAGILGINQNGSLGDVNNDITIGNGARLLAEPGSNTGTITLPASRTFTLAGAQSQIGAGNANVNLVIEGDLNQSAAGNGLVITDSGRVTLAGNLNYTGETRLAGGTLALSGPALLPSTQNLRFNSGLATLDVGSTVQTIRTIVFDGTSAANRVITGGGSFTINGDSNQAFGGRNAQTYDFGGLGAFTFNRANRDFKVETVNVAAVTTVTDVNLAKGGASGGTNSITANLVQVGGGNSDGNNGNTARLHLGTANTIRANTFLIGGFNAGGVVDFQAGLTAPSLTLRGVDGVAALPTWRIGETSSGARRGEGVVNLANGSIDALVTDLTVGRHLAGANNADTSSLTIAGGTLTASTITLAQKAGTGTPTLDARINQNGGTVTATTVTLGTDAAGGATARLLPTYNLNGGTLRAATIDGGSGAFGATSSRTLSINGGALHNYDGATDLAIDGTDATAGGLLNVVIGTNGATIAADAGRSVSVSALAPITGTGLLTKSGNGLLILSGSASPSITISAGSVVLNATGSVSGPQIRIDSGATLDVSSIAGGYSFAATQTLSGNGTITGAINVVGSISPGASIGTLSFAGMTDLAGTLIVELDGTGTGMSDLLNVTGNLDITGAAVDFSTVAAGTAPDDAAYVFATYTGTLSGTFAATNVPSGYDVVYGYDNGTTSGNIALVSAVPEPATLSAIAAAGALLMRRRRAAR